MGNELRTAKTWSLQATTVRRALQEGAEFLSRMGIESARIDAEVLLGAVLRQKREGLCLNGDGLLKTSERELFCQALWRRGQREPLAYITGEREFWSLDFIVTPEVLVPRPETECLVEVALEHARQLDKNLPLQILDLGTGSGAVAVSLATELGDLQVWATDLSAEALEVARVNADRHRVREKIRFLQGDLFEPFAVEPVFFHLVVSNPPYVARGEIENLPPEVRDWEPRLALDGGLDGLDLYRRIVEQGHLYLADGGFMLLEIGADMGEEVSQLFAHVGCYAAASVYRDYAGRDRVVVARQLRSNK